MLTRLFAIVLLAALAGCNDTADYCYVEAGSFGSPLLRASIQWAPDRLVGVFATHTEALAAAREIGCEVRP